MAVVGNHCAMGGGGDGARLVEGGLCSATHGPTTPPALAGLACTGQVGPTRCGTSTTSSSMTSSKRCCEGFAGGDWHGTLKKGHQHTLVFYTDNPVLKQLCQWGSSKVDCPPYPTPHSLVWPASACSPALRYQPSTGRRVRRTLRRRALLPVLCSRPAGSLGGGWRYHRRLWRRGGRQHLPHHRRLHRQHGAADWQEREPVLRHVRSICHRRA